MKKPSTPHYSVPSSTYSQPERLLNNKISYISKAIGLLLITLLLTFHVDAQHVNFEWAKSLGSSEADVSNAIALDSRGNVYVTGYFEESMVVDLGTHTDTLIAIGNANVFLSKYDSSGQCIWAKAMGGAGSDAMGVAIAVDTADNVYMAGLFGLSADFNADGTGGTLTAIGYIDMFLAKYDSDGNYQWAQSVGTNIYMGLDYGLAVDKSTNDVYVVGAFAGSGDFNPGAGTATLTAVGNADIFIAKYAQNGDYIWAKNIGGSGGSSGANDVALDTNGNVYVTGVINGTADFNPGGSGGVITAIGNNDVFLAKYDSDGNYHWARNMGGSNNDYAYGTAVDGNGNVYITGTFAFSNNTVDFNLGGPGGLLTPIEGSSTIFLAKYDSAGHYLWVNAMGAMGSDIGFGIAIDRTDNVYITGHYSYSVDFDPDGRGDTLTTVGDNVLEVDYDVFVAKYDSSGDYLWAKSMGSSFRDNGNGIAVDNKNNVYLTGSFSQSANFNPNGLNGVLDYVGGSDAFVVKLSQDCKLYTTFIESACDSFSFNSVTYTTSGVYSDTFPSLNNCDSIVVLDLTITGQTTENPVISGHYCDSVTFNGITYLASGIYTQLYSNTGGCDSIITYDLTIGQSNTGELTLTVCDSLVFNDKAYTASGTYTQTLTNSSGCDSILTIELIVNNSPQASVVLTGSTLTANNADTYQWVDCDNDYASIAGATQQSFTPAETGNYSVIITNENGCNDTATCTFVEVGSNNIVHLSLDNKVRVFPNPAQNQVHIQTMKSLNKATIRLVNILGQVLDERENQEGQLFSLDMAAYTPGLYFLDISESGNVIRVKVVKE